MENITRYSPSPVILTLATCLLVLQIIIIREIPPAKLSPPSFPMARTINLHLKPAAIKNTTRITKERKTSEKKAKSIKKPIQKTVVKKVKQPLKQIELDKTLTLKKFSEVEPEIKPIEKESIEEIFPSSLPLEEPLLPVIQASEQVKQNLASALKANHQQAEVSDIKLLGSLIRQYISSIDLLDYYPKSAIRRNIKGTVLVSLKFDRHAEIQGFHLKSTSGYSILDRAAFQMMEDHENELDRVIGHYQLTFSNQVKVSLPISFTLR